MAAVAATTVAGAQERDAQLQRVRGEVGYQPAAAAAPRPLLGAIDVRDDTRAVTAARAAAILRLPDSSVVEIGDRTDVEVGALRLAEGGDATIRLHRGALRFAIRHPQGARTTYRFVTPTGQLAVRGTVAYLTSGPDGDEVYCVDCAAGDVTYTAAYETNDVRTGQTLEVRRNGRAVDARIVANAAVNNPAIDQFLHGFSPFGRPAGEGFDPTGSGSGAP